MATKHVHHPILEVIMSCERAWSDSDEQACRRADLIARALHAHGFVEGEFRDGCLLAPSETSREAGDNVIRL